jgi:hypothetical protein
MYGYRFDKEHDTLAPHAEESRIYRQMVAWLVNGRDGERLSASQIAQALSADRVPAPDGGRWYRATVARILKNPAYTGTFYYGKTTYVQDQGVTRVRKNPPSEWQAVPIPALIDRATYDAVQERLSTLRTQTRGRPPRTPSLIKGIGRCGQCGGPVQAGPPSRDKRTGEPRRHYYRCGRVAPKYYEAGRANPGCRSRPWRQDVIDATVWTAVVEALEAPEHTVAQRLHPLADPSAAARLEERRAQARHALKRLEDRRARYLDLYADGILSKIELAPRVATVDDARQKALADLAQADREWARWTTHAQLDPEAGEAMRVGFHAMLHGDGVAPPLKRQIIQRLVRQVVLHEDSIELVAAWDIDEPPQSAETTNGAHGQGHGRP